MKFGKAFGIKLLRFTLNLFFFVGLVFNEPLHVILTLILVLAPLTFVIGDLLILPKFGNMVAVLLDAPMFLAGIWGIHALLGVTMRFGHIFLFLMITLALCAEEFLYHNYVQRNVFGKDIPTISEMINNL
jgi:hypothetical protein